MLMQSILCFRVHHVTCKNFAWTCARLHKIPKKSYQRSLLSFQTEECGFMNVVCVICGTKSEYQHVLYPCLTHEGWVYFFPQSKLSCLVLTRWMLKWCFKGRLECFSCTLISSLFITNKVVEYYFLKPNIKSSNPWSVWLNLKIDLVNFHWYMVY